MENKNLLRLAVLGAVALMIGSLMPHTLADSSSVAYVKVAVLNSTANPPYATGGFSNNVAGAVEVLNKDPYIIVQNVTDAQIQAGLLISGKFDVLLFIDNLPDNNSNSMIWNFWNNSGGGLVALDSAICFLCYMGILPQESSGSNGHDVYWDYFTGTTARISTAHPVTAGYTVGENITGQSSDARYNVTKLAGTTGYPYYTKLAEGITDSDFAYASAYEPPSKGRVVHIWDNHMDNIPTRLLLMNAIKWAGKAPSLEELLGVNALQSQLNALSSQLSSLMAQLNALQTQLGTINSTLADEISALNAQITSLSASLSTTNSTLSNQTSNLGTRLDTATVIGYGGVAVGVIGIIVAVAAIMLSRPKKSPP
jgi:flagellin-like hook-associated protein FlgL